MGIESVTSRFTVTEMGGLAAMGLTSSAAALAALTGNKRVAQALIPCAVGLAGSLSLLAARRARIAEQQAVANNREIAELRDENNRTVHTEVAGTYPSPELKIIQFGQSVLAQTLRNIDQRTADIEAQISQQTSGADRK